MISRVGAKLGNWNDKKFGGHDSRAQASPLWKMLDRVAYHLYLVGE